jgi:TetR/AcrR family transcriptional repressor of bet genes
VSARKKKSDAATPRARSAHGRQRQRLIDACISALHIHGPSRTTVEKVVAIAKMSPGIVRFYFDSKAAMLVASLQFLSAEFEEQVLSPVSRLKANPVAALELLVDLYLDPEIASPRKVSVWYAFWGEANSRQEYYDICGQKDESFAALVRELIGRLIEDSGQRHLDTDGVALGLIGALEMLWQDFAFRSEEDIDRKAAKRRCMAYLESVFPGRFAPPASGREQGAAPAESGIRLAGWVYGTEAAAALERESLFRGAWQIVAHESEVRRAGDFVSVNLGTERVLVVRDGFGALHALRNSCPDLPHALAEESRGHFDGSIECRTHRLAFGLDGRRTPGGGALDLVPLDLAIVEGLIVVAARDAPRGAQPWLEGKNAWLESRHLDGLQPMADTLEIEVAANWKLVVEQWLESCADVAPSREASSLVWTAAPGEGPATSASRSRKGGGARERWVSRFVMPNQLIEWRFDGLSILQAIPAGPAHCRVRRLELARAGAEGAASPQWRTPWDGAARLGIAESAQKGVLEFGYRAAAQAKVPAALAWFRRHLARHVPALALERPPNVS